MGQSHVKGVGGEGGKKEKRRSAATSNERPESARERGGRWGLETGHSGFYAGTPRTSISRFCLR